MTETIFWQQRTEYLAKVSPSNEYCVILMVKVWKSSYEHMCMLAVLLLHIWAKPMMYRFWINSWHVCSTYMREDCLMSICSVKTYIIREECLVWLMITNCEPWRRMKTVRKEKGHSYMNKRSCTRMWITTFFYPQRAVVVCTVLLNPDYSWKK